MPRPKGGSSRSELVRLAIAGIDAQIQELMDKRKEFAKMAPGAAGSGPAVAAAASVSRVVVTGTKAAPAKKKRVVSAATRKKLKEAAKARWARVRAERG
ncbi:MAG: hypothetical protein J2P41_10515 [Blastocatellia bacterium]|nr:hypothetical protein [Blastocatellia bacterium]